MNTVVDVPWLLAPVRKYKGHPDGRCSTFEAVVALLRTLGHPKDECEALLHNMRIKVDAVLVGLWVGGVFVILLLLFCFLLRVRVLALLVCDDDIFLHCLCGALTARGQASDICHHSLLVCTGAHVRVRVRGRWVGAVTFNINFP